MKGDFHITVTDPKTGKSITWKSTNKQRLIKQARIEVKAGAQVEIRNNLMQVVWKG